MKQLLTRVRPSAHGFGLQMAETPVPDTMLVFDEVQAALVMQEVFEVLAKMLPSTQTQSPSSFKERVAGQVLTFLQTGRDRRPRGRTSTCAHAETGRQTFALRSRTSPELTTSLVRGSRKRQLLTEPTFRPRPTPAPTSMPRGAAEVPVAKSAAMATMAVENMIGMMREI